MGVTITANQTEPDIYYEQQIWGIANDATTVSGSIFLDVDGDGVDDGAGEAGVPYVGVRVWNDISNNGVIDIGTDTIVAGTMTNSSGDYTFTGIADGDFLVEAYDPTYQLRMGSFTTTHPIDTTIVASTPISGQSIGFLRTTMLLPTVSANFASDGVASTIEINDTTANGPVLSDSDKYGSSIANIGDLNGDGVDDIAVGAYFDDNGGTNRGALHIHFMNTNGSIDSTVEINDATANGPVLADNDQYGFSIANMGDLNGDGVQDIAVGANLDDNGGTDRGALHIHFMNTDGSIDSTVEINDSTTNGPPPLANTDQYGFSVANMGDLNGDGVQDIAVGANLDDDAGTNRGAVYISFLNTDGSIDSTVAINDATTNGPVLANADEYGSSVANIGDLNGDGVQDLASGGT
jgi:FG-GAP repeat